MVTFYVGCVVMGLALWGFWRGSKRETRLALIAAGAFFLSLGAYCPGYARLSFLHVFRFPANWLWPATTAVALLCGAGLASIRQPAVQKLCLGLVACDLLFFNQSPRVAWFDLSFLSHPPSLADLIYRPNSFSRV